MSKVVTKIRSSDTAEAPTVIVNGVDLTSAEAPSGDFNTYTTVNTVLTETVPAGVGKALIRCWGAGASGSLSGSGSNKGGGGGAFCEVLANVTPGQTSNIYVGQGGDRASQLGTIAEGGTVSGTHNGAGGGGTLIALDNGGSFTLYACAGGGGGAGGSSGIGGGGGGAGGQPGHDGSSGLFGSAGGGNNGVGGVGVGLSEKGQDGEDMNISETLFTDFNGRGGDTANLGDGAGSGGGGFGGGGAGSGATTTSGAGGGSYTYLNGGTILDGVDGATAGGNGAGKTQLTEDGLPSTIGDGSPEGVNGIGGAVSIRYYTASNALIIAGGVVADGLTTSGQTSTGTLKASGMSTFDSNLLVNNSSIQAYNTTSDRYLTHHATDLEFYDGSGFYTYQSFAGSGITWNHDDDTASYKFTWNNADDTLVVKRFSTEPGFDNSSNLGSASKRWKEVFAVNGAINTSDRREKKDIVPSQLGLDFVNMLKPVCYKWIEGTRPHYGFISQDLKETMDELDIDFGGYTKSLKFKPNPEGGGDIPDGDILGIRYNELISPLTKAIQELSQKNNKLDEKILSERYLNECKFQELRDEIILLKKENNAHDCKFQDLESKIELLDDSDTELYSDSDYDPETESSRCKIGVELEKAMGGYPCVIL